MARYTDEMNQAYGAGDLNAIKAPTDRVKCLTCAITSARMRVDDTATEREAVRRVRLEEAQGETDTHRAMEKAYRLVLVKEAEANAYQAKWRLATLTKALELAVAEV